jgi:transcriptional regulator with XRE-family HTH domain
VGTRITNADMRPLAKALRETRTARGAVQEEMADALGMSRKTYLLFENARWYPAYKERAYLLARLHEIEPALVPVFLGVTGETLGEHVLVREVAAAVVTAPVLSVAATKAAYETVVAEVAVERDMTISATRKVAAALVKRLAAAGVTVEGAAGVAA